MRRFLMATFSLVFLSLESHAIGPVAPLGSVGVVGPEGDVILYYKDGKDIVIKQCNLLSVLGATPAQAKERCQGRSVKVSVKAFKKAIREKISTAPLNHLKPLTEQDVTAYKKDGISSENLNKVIVELDAINALIKASGRENAPLVRLDELTATLNNNEALVSAIKKIDKEIETAINLIVDEQELRIVDAKTNDCNGETEKPFLYTVLKNFGTSKLPCGLKGSVEERIKNCSSVEGAKKGNSVLVAKTVDGNEVYKDTKSGLIWSDRLSKEMNHHDAVRACKAGLPEMAGIGVSWRLPSEEEYKRAEKNGIRSSIASKRYWWSSSIPRSHALIPLWFNDGYGYDHGHNRSDRKSVRCVLR